MEDKNKEKQVFLKKEIIEQEYDADAFSLWMQMQKEDGCNLDHWTLEELGKVVEKFKDSNQPIKARNLDETLDLANFEIELSPGTGSGDLTNSGSINLEDEGEDLFFKGIEKVEEEENFDLQYIKDIKCLGVAHEKKNLFTSRKLFLIETLPNGWKVYRRFSDFKWLSERLNREFPEISVKPTLNILV